MHPIAHLHPATDAFISPSLDTTASATEQLQQAATHGEQEHCRKALQQGADPRAVVTDANTKPDIAKLLNAAVLIQQLYSRNASQPAGLTHIERALITYDLEEVKKILPQYQDLSNTWSQAVKNRRPDVICALLALHSKDDIFRFYREERHPDKRSVLHDAMHLGYPPLKAYLKQFPYFSKRGDPGIKENCKIPFKDNPARLVSCRAIGPRWNDIRQQSQKTLTPKEVAGLSYRASEKKWLDIPWNASEIHLFDPSEWKEFFTKQFDAMEESAANNGKKPPLKRWIDIETINHCFSIELKITIENGVKQCSFGRLDPTTTYAHKRASTEDRNWMRSMWSLPSILDRPSDMFTYCLTPGTAVMACVRPDPPSTEQAPTKDQTLAQHENKIFYGKGVKPTDNFILLHFATHNFLPGWESAISEILQLGDPAAAKLLNHKTSKAPPQLYSAAENGHGVIATRTLEVIDQLGISDEEKSQVASGKDLRGTPALYMATEHKQINFMHAYIDGVMKMNIENDRKIELLAGAWEEEGMSALSKAIIDGEVDVARAYIEKIIGLAISPDDKAGLLLAEMPDGDLAIHEAKQANNKAMLDMYRTAMEPLKDHPTVKLTLKNI